jgi:hypothetical protein
VELLDVVEFDPQAGQCESVLTTFAAVEIGAGTVLIRGTQGQLRVRFDPAVVSVRVETEPQVDLGIGPADVNCIVFAFHQPVLRGTICLRIEPV